MPDQPSTPDLFTSWFAGHARGSVDREMALAVAEVTDAVTFLDKKGKVTLTLDFERVGATAVKITAKVKAAAPEAPEASIFYRDSTGSLTRNDPEGLVHESQPEGLNPAAVPPDNEAGIVVEGADGPILVASDGEVIRKVAGE